MKAGVRISPCGVLMVPVRPLASASTVPTVNEKPVMKRPRHARPAASRPVAHSRSAHSTAPEGHGSRQARQQSGTAKCLYLGQPHHARCGGPQHSLRDPRSGMPPAATNAVASSSSARPPSGPTITSTSPSTGSSPATSQSEASSCSTKVSAGSPILSASSAVVSGGLTRGTRKRLDCFVASRTMLRQRASARSTLSGAHLTTDRDACQGTISSTPSSVSISRASSDRSPLASAWTTVNRSGRSE